MQRINILFLCRGNSARSIMAEAIANQRFGNQLAAVSAGTQPTGTPHPLALATLKKHGLDTGECHSESWRIYEGRKFDLVVTLCGTGGEEECPFLSGNSGDISGGSTGGLVRVHWGFPDPPAADDPAGVFEEVYRGLEEALELFTAESGEDLDLRAARVAGLVNQRFAI